MNKILRLGLVGAIVVTFLFLVFGCLAASLNYKSSAETMTELEPIIVTRDYVLKEHIELSVDSSLGVHTVDLESASSTPLAGEAEEKEPAKLQIDIKDVSKASNFTLEQLTSYVEVYCPAFVGLEEYLLEIDSKINLVFLLAVSRCETDGGNPEKMVGDCNIFNIRNQDGSYCDYNSYRESLDHFVRLITKEYLNPEGWWYEGTSIEAIGRHYAAEGWAPFITSVCEEILWIADPQQDT